jgi:hypothetical protein
LALLYFLLSRLAPEAIERRAGSAALFFRDRLCSSTFILAGIALPGIYPAATAVDLRMALLPSVIPMIRLLPRLLPKIFRPWIYLLVLLYVVDFSLFAAAGLAFGPAFNPGDCSCRPRSDS